MSSSTSSLMPDSSGLLTKIKERGGAILKPRLKPIQPCWPNSEESVGSFYDTIDGEKYWKLKDQRCTAFLAFSQLVERLEAVLRKHTEASLDRVLWRAFMIGNSRPLCALGIIFCCSNAEYRKEAGIRISASKEVDETSGVIIKYRAKLPRLKGTLMALGGSQSDSEQGQQEARQGPQLPGALSQRPLGPMSGRDYPEVTLASSAYLSEASPWNNSVNSKAVSKKSEVFPKASPGYSLNLPVGVSTGCFSHSTIITPGTLLYMQRDSVRKATIGGAIRFKGQQYLVTSAHPFTDEESPAKSIRSQRPTESMGSVRVGHFHFASTFNGNPELDYALVRTPRVSILMEPLPSERHSNGLIFPKFTSEESFKDLGNTTITAKGGSGNMVGEIERIPDFLRIPGSEIAQEVFAVTTKSPLAPGDSGSWVIDSSDATLHGHIVAGVPEDNLAFIVPAYKVFVNLNEVISSTHIAGSKIGGG